MGSRYAETPPDGTAVPKARAFLLFGVMFASFSALQPAGDLGEALRGGPKRTGEGCGAARSCLSSVWSQRS